MGSLNAPSSIPYIDILGTAPADLDSLPHAHLQLMDDESSEDNDSEYVSCASSFDDDCAEDDHSACWLLQDLHRASATSPLPLRYAANGKGQHSNSRRRDPYNPRWYLGTSMHAMIRNGLVFHYSSLTLSTSRTRYTEPGMDVIGHPTQGEAPVVDDDTDGVTIALGMRRGGHNLECENTSPTPDQTVLREHLQRSTRLIGTIPSSNRKQVFKHHRRRSSSSWLDVRRFTIDPNTAPDAWCTGGLLGSGTYGRVHHIYNKTSGAELAVKVIDIKDSLPGIICDGLLTELLVLEQLAQTSTRLPFLLYPTNKRSWAWRSSNDFLFMLMELCPGGDLWRYRQQLNGPTLRLVIAELILGIESLHNLGIVHHDLKPENILIDADGHCVIADYGSAKFLASDGLLFRNVNEDVLATMPYAAPELLSTDLFDEKSLAYYDETVDWWALGALIITLVTGEEYFTRGNVDELISDMEWLVENVPKILKSCKCSEDLVDIVVGLLKIDPIERVRTPAVKDHPYFRSINWELLEKRSPNFASPFPPKRKIVYHDGQGKIDCPAIDGPSYDFVDDLHYNGLDLQLDDTFSLLI